MKRKLKRKSIVYVPKNASKSRIKAKKNEDRNNLKSFKG